MAYTQNEWRIHKCYQQGEEKDNDNKNMIP